MINKLYELYFRSAYVNFSSGIPLNYGSMIEFIDRTISDFDRTNLSDYGKALYFDFFANTKIVEVFNKVINPGISVNFHRNR
jgi:hypothetical protein